MSAVNQEIGFAIAMLAVGIALMIALDPWIVGLAFVIIGGTRLASARPKQRDEETEGTT